MSFNSLQFLIFLPVVVVIYFLMPFRYRWLWLLLASYYFYMSWKAEYALLMVASTAVSFFTALWMAATTNQTQRKLFLAISLVVNLGVLFLFKYFNFFNESLRVFLQQFSLAYTVPELKILLPVGISFYTFQTLSYTIDVYYQRQKPETHLGIFALYVAFFPQLVAGPIERSTNLIPQFHQKQRVDAQRVASGLRLILWGLFKKIVIADRLAIYVNTVYNNPHGYTGWPIWLATYFFAFQIYCDFSAYSDIAIGAARLMGYDLMRNFRQPYFSTSIPEFWRRWHISLSTWFKDYLYIPLGGNRVLPWRRYVNLFVVFVVSGLWHGANWTFVIWGALHGAFSMLSVYLAQHWQQVKRPWASRPYLYMISGLNLLLTFHIVVLAWVFFRADSLGDALILLRNATQLGQSKLASLLIVNPNQFIIGWGAIIVLLVVDLMHSRGLISPFMQQRPQWIRWGIYSLLLIGILAFGEYRSQDFIYFQF